MPGLAIATEQLRRNCHADGLVVAVGTNGAGVMSLRIESEDPAVPLSHTTIQRVRWETLFRAMTVTEPSPEQPARRLVRPSKRNLPSLFYGEVAGVYRYAVANGYKPRAVIAAQAGVSVDSAARWIREARKRGFLPTTTPGRARA